MFRKNLFIIFFGIIFILPLISCQEKVESQIKDTDKKNNLDISAYLTTKMSCIWQDFKDKKCIPGQPELSNIRDEEIRHDDLSLSLKNIIGKNMYRLVDLNADGEPEVLIYENADPLNCGTGGCGLTIFKKKGNGHTKLHEFSIVKIPFIISDTMTNGFRDIIFPRWLFDDFMQYYVARFQSGKYPFNPTVIPFLKENYTVEGEYIFEDTN